MKYSIALLALTTLAVVGKSQVQVDKPIQFNGPDGQRRIENLETPVAGTDAANKDYVDQQTASSGGPQSTMQYALSVQPATLSVPLFGNNESAPVTIRATYSEGSVDNISYLMTGTPPGVYASLNPGTTTPNSQSKLVFYVEGTATPGSYPITITALGGIANQSIEFTLIVQIPKRVFVSGFGISGNMGGIAGANAHCQSAATAAGLTGTFRAWISTASQSPSTTFTQSSSPYVLVNNALVATSWADLIDGELANPINLNEYGNNVGNVKVWTQTFPNGTYDNGNCTAQCANWTSNSTSSYARWGNSGASNGAWSSTGDGSGNGACGSGTWECNQCNCSNRLYCFEQ